MRKFLRFFWITILILCGSSFVANADECQHDYFYSYDSCVYENVDNSNHRVKYTCLFCGNVKYELWPHSWTQSRIVKATIASPGVQDYRCYNCGATKTETFSWTPGGANCQEYEFSDCTEVYKNTKKMSVALNAPVPNGILTVKLGKKTYTAPLENGLTATIKFKKKPKPFQTIYVTVTLNGQIVANDYTYVWYAKKVRRGMSKKQVQFTWGDPDNVTTGSGGWTYWWYDDGSSVTFKGKRVKSWYDANP